MTTKELRAYIDRILGNSIRCLLPSYWWKRAFGATIDAVESVEENVKNTVKGKQDILVSGQNIKTINSQSILGDGDISIAGGSDIIVDSSLSTTSVNPVQNKVITKALNDKADQDDLVYKQDKLFSGQNIKTVNGESILGEGDLSVAPLSITDDVIDNEEVLAVALNDLNSRLEKCERLLETIINNTEA